MMNRVMIVSLAALVALAIGIQEDALGHGACGMHEKVKASSGTGCTKPCGDAADADKQACAVKGAGGCCGSEACAVKKDKACCGSEACAAKAAKACCGSEACTPKQCAKAAVKSAEACGTACGKPGEAKEEIAEINTAGLKALLDSGARVTVLDARSGKYDDGRRIPGAKSLAANASEKEIKRAIRKKDTLVVTYCSNLKCPASAMLAERLIELGYENVIEYRYGIDGWAEAGYKVKQAE